MKKITLLLALACMTFWGYAQTPATQREVFYEGETSPPEQPAGQPETQREVFYENGTSSNSRQSRERTREQVRRDTEKIRQEANELAGQAGELAREAREQAEREVDRALGNIGLEGRYRNPDKAVEGAETRTYSLSLADGKSRRRRSFRWRDGHYAGVGLYYNGLVSSLGNLKLPADGKFLSLSTKSIGITLNPIDFALPTGGRTAFVTGLGFELNNFRFDNNIGLKREEGVTVPDYQYDDMGVRLKKSKLFTAYMNIPILFEVQMGRHNDFFINAGVVGGLRIGSHTKVKADSEQLKGKFKDHGNMGLRNFHYGYTFNAGYRWIAISATYYGGSLFRSGQGPDVKQVNIGLSLMF